MPFYGYSNVYSNFYLPAMSPLLNSRIIYDYDAEKKKKKCEEENRTQKIPGNDIMSTKTNIFATVATLSVMREKRRSLRYDKN